MNSSIFNNTGARVCKPVIYRSIEEDVSRTPKCNSFRRFIKISKSCFYYLDSSFKSMAHQLSKIIRKVFHKHSYSKTEVKVQKQFENITFNKSQLKAAGVSKRKVKNLVRKGMKQDPGTHNLVTRKGRKILISTITDPQKQEKAVAIHVIAQEQFAEGAYGEVRGAISFGSQQSVVEKRARVSAGQRGLADIENEYSLLTELHQGGLQEGIQAPPYTVVTDGRNNVVGYIGRRYLGNGEELVQRKINTPPKEMINNLNKGLLTIWERGFFHGDHKLENTLYSINEGKVNLVVADFGGDIRRNDFKGLLEGYIKEYGRVKQFAGSNNGQDELQAKIVASLEEGLNILKNKIIGVHTECTTYNNDLIQQKLLINDLCEKNITLEECLKQFEEITEARVVFAQAVVSCCLLIGVSDIVDNGLVTEVNNPKFKNLDEFKKKLDEGGLKVKLSDSQYQILFNALETDYKKRPSLQQFAQAWTV